MINLLPPAIKKDITFARRNTLLKQWVFITLVLTIGLSVLTFFGDLYIKNSIKAYQSQNQTIQQQITSDKLSKDEAQLTAISNNVKLVNQVLSKEVLFSKLLQQMGAAMPAGSVLENLQIAGVQGALNINARATSYTTATQIQVNLQDPVNKIFQKVDIVSIDCSEINNPSPNPLSQAYPCKVQLTGLFAKNNPFLFVNNGSGGN